MLNNLFNKLTKPLLQLISNRFNQLYPNFGNKLGNYQLAKQLIIIQDLKLKLLISFNNGQLSLNLALNRQHANSIITGDSKYFFQLLQKAADSDALFFSSKLMISGDIEAATALRNNLERIDFDLIRFLTPFNKLLIDDLLDHKSKTNDLVIRKNKALELVCPAGNPLMLKSAINAGADTIYFGFNQHGNARNFTGLNFSFEEAAEALVYAKANQVKMFAAINAYPQANNLAYIKKTIDAAYDIGVNAIILADIGLLDYASNKYPDLARHLSVQASASSIDSLEFYATEFGISRAILPRVLDFNSISEIAKAMKSFNLEVEVFGFGGLCIMAEGRCSLSGYLTGKSPNLQGVCSPAKEITYINTQDKLAINLNQFQINEFKKGETLCYPTICKGKFNIQGQDKHPFEDPTSLSLISSLNDIVKSGVSAIKIEGRQRSSFYATQVIKTFRYAVDNLANLTTKDLNQLNLHLITLMEGSQSTTGAYYANWN